MIAAQRLRSTRKNYDVLGAGLIGLSPATAPTGFVVDDVNKAAGWTPVGAVGADWSKAPDYEYSVDFGKSWKGCYWNPQPLPPAAYAIGQVQIRARARPFTGSAGGNSPSTVISNATAYTSTAVPAFSMASVPNQVFRFDMGDTAHMTKDGSNIVSQINDLTGNGNHLTLIGGAGGPTFIPGSPGYVAFSSTGKLGLASLVVTPPLTLYVVLKPVSTTSIPVWAQMNTAWDLRGENSWNLTANNFTGTVTPGWRSPSGDVNSPYSFGATDFASVQFIKYEFNGSNSYVTIGNDVAGKVNTSDASAWAFFNIVNSMNVYAMMLVNGLVAPQIDAQIKAYYTATYSVPTYEGIENLGDSITLGSNDPVNHGWTWRLAQATGKRYRNFGVGGTYLTPTANPAGTLNSFNNLLFNAFNTPKNYYITIMYGSNPDYLPSYPAGTVSVKCPSIWIQFLRDRVQMLIDYGFSKSKIFLIAPPASPRVLGGTGVSQAVYLNKERADVKALASALGVQFLDFYTESLNYIAANGGSNTVFFDTDNLHPISAGHQDLSNYAQPFFP